MTVDSPPAPTPFAARLGLAHRVLAMLAALGAVYAIIPWPMLPAGENLRPLAGAALGVLLGGLVYLTASMTVHLRWAVLLRRGELIGKGGATLSLLGHAIVVACAASVMAARAASNTLLVSLDRLVATLISVALLSLLMSAVDLVSANLQELRERKMGERKNIDPPRHFNPALGWALLLIATAMALAAGIFSLERREVPRGEVEKTSMLQ